ncbi:MAG: hypothetical protein JRD89_01270 [Deltaproteobacteria bacterium]|nr:hypothetical protein [Deltaproteobacteria bacterium]
MKLGKVTIKDGQTWIIVKDFKGNWKTVHIDAEAESVEDRGNTIEVKMRRPRFALLAEEAEG